MAGVMDAIAAPRPASEAQSAAGLLLAMSRSERVIVERKRIDIDIIVRDNLP